MFASAFSTIMIFYYSIKLIYLYSLVKIQAKFDTLTDHYIFLAVFYTAGIAFLSYVFVMAPQQSPNLRAWGIWLAKTFGLSAIYFKLLAKFDEGAIFWILLMLGIGLVWF